MHKAEVCLACLVIISSFHGIQTVKVLKSRIKLDEEGLTLSGAKLKDARQVNVTDITLCIRFNYKLLGFHEGRSTLITIAEWKNDPEVSEVAYHKHGLLVAPFLSSSTLPFELK